MKWCRTKDGKMVLSVHIEETFDRETFLNEIAYIEKNYPYLGAYCWTIPVSANIWNYSGASSAIFNNNTVTNNVTYNLSTNRRDLVCVGFAIDTKQILQDILQEVLNENS